MIEFLNPRYLHEAYELLDKRGDEIKLCGGLTHLLRFYNDFPNDVDSKLKAFMYLGDLPALSECREEMSRYLIGAGAKISDLAADHFVSRYAQAIAQAASETSSPQIRNQRTVGGELVWGSYHSPLVVAALALEAKIRVRFAAENKTAGREETLSIEDLYGDDFKRTNLQGDTFVSRQSKLKRKDMLVKLVLSDDVVKRRGFFSFFKALTPKITTDNPGVVIAVSGVVQDGVFLSAKLVASGAWMKTCSERLPLEGVKAIDVAIYEKLYHFCERYRFDSYRREEGPSGPQLGLIIFGLLKQGFAETVNITRG